MSIIHIKYGLLVLFPTILLSCQTHSQDKWTPGMELTIYEGGGMVPESKTVIIEDSIGTYVHWVQHKRDTFHFRLTQQDLNSLVKQINRSQFNDIISGETGGIAYDKPTTSIELKWDGETHEVNVGATTNIKKGDAGAFYELYRYILTVALKKTGQPLN